MQCMDSFTMHTLNIYSIDCLVGRSQSKKVSLKINTSLFVVLCSFCLIFNLANDLFDIISISINNKSLHLSH